MCITIIMDNTIIQWMCTRIAVLSSTCSGNRALITKLQCSYLCGANRESYSSFTYFVGMTHKKYQSNKNMIHTIWFERKPKRIWRKLVLRRFLWNWLVLCVSGVYVGINLFYITSRNSIYHSDSVIDENKKRTERLLRLSSFIFISLRKAQHNTQ